MSLIVSSTTDTQAEVDAAAGLEPTPIEEQQQQPEAAEPKPKQPPPPKPPDEEEEEEPGEETPVRAKGRGGFQRKIERLQRENEYLARRMQELDYNNARAYLQDQYQSGRMPMPNGAPHHPVADGPPRQDQFESYEQYIDAATDYKVNLALQKLETKQQQEAQQRAHQQQVSSWHERVGSFRNEAPDFDEVLADVDHIQVPQVLQQALMRDPNGPKLAYELARNPERFAELARLDPLAQLTALGELKASLNHAAQAAPPPRPKAVSQAPAPIRPVGQGAAASTVPYDQLNFQDFKRRRNSDIAARRER